MEIAKIRVSDVHAEVVSQKPVPAGIIGATITVEYTDPIWDGLHKTVVFSGCTTKDVLSSKTVITVPAEVVARPGTDLLVSFYGVGPGNTLVVPTLRASLGKIQPAADPSGDASAKPTLPVWAQLQQELDVPVVLPKAVKAPATLTEDEFHVYAKGERFAYAFSKQHGMFDSLVIDGRERLAGPVSLTAYRAIIDNEIYCYENWKYTDQFKAENMDRAFTKVYDVSVSDGVIKAKCSLAVCRWCATR